MKDLFFYFFLLYWGENREVEYKCEGYNITACLILNWGYANTLAWDYTEGTREGCNHNFSCCRNINQNNNNRWILKRIHAVIQGFSQDFWIGRLKIHIWGELGVQFLFIPLHYTQNIWILGCPKSAIGCPKDTRTPLRLKACRDRYM